MQETVPTLITEMHNVNNDVNGCWCSVHINRFFFYFFFKLQKRKGGGGGGGTVSTKVAFFVVSGPNCSRLAKGAVTTTQVVGSADSPEYVCLCQQPHKEAHGISSVCTNSACSHSHVTRFTFLSFFFFFFPFFGGGWRGAGGGGGGGGSPLNLVAF